MVNMVDSIGNLKRKFFENFQRNGSAAKEIVAANMIFARDFVFKNTPLENRPTQQQQMLSAICGVHEQTIRRIESGKENPTFESALRLCTAMEVPMGYMFISGGSKLYLEGTERSNGHSKKLSEAAIATDEKDLVIYFDDDVPMMKKSDGKTRVFNMDDVIVFKKHIGGDFFVAFNKNENGKKCIMHHYIYQPGFRVNGIQFLHEMEPEWIKYRLICSSVLFVSWNRAFSPSFDVVKSNVFRNLSYYINSSNK